MTLENFIAFLSGIYIEIITLNSDALRRSSGSFLNHTPVIAGMPIDPVRLWTMGGLTTGALLIGLFRLFGIEALRVDIGHPLIGPLFVGLGLYLLGAGVLTGHLMPRVNEQSVLIVLVLVVLNELLSPTRDHPAALFFLLALPVGVILYLLIRRSAIGPINKAVVYMGYLMALLALSIMGGSTRYFENGELSPSETFLAGSVGVFLLLHGLFSVRFFLMVSSLILPRNRVLIPPVMERLFSDEQVALRPFLLFTALMAGMVLANGWLRWVPADTLASVLVVISVQWLFRSEAAAPFSTKANARVTR